MTTPDTLDRYPRLPDELKLEIWRHAIPSPAAHRFKLIVPSVFANGGVVMSIEPINPSADKDPSVWRDAWNCSAVDNIAREVVGPLENRVLLWQFGRRGSRRNVEDAVINVEDTPRNVENAASREAESLRPRHGCKATIDGSRDLVLFRLAGEDLDPWLLARAENRRLMRGIARVAIEWKNPSGPWRGWNVPPFNCTCNGVLSHSSQVYCHSSLAKFLSLFQDMETFYIILRISRKQIDERWLAGQENLRKQKAEAQRAAGIRNVKAEPDPGETVPATLKPAKNKSAPEVIGETMAFFKGICLMIIFPCPQ